MTKLMMKTWRGKQEVDMARALTPSPYLVDHRGAVEDAQAQAKEALEVVGRVLAALVEHGVLPIEEAIKIAGTEYNVEVVEE